MTTSDSNAISAKSYFPVDNRIIFTSDQGWNELNHIYIKNIDGAVIDLTPDSAKASYYGWNYEKTAIFWASNRRDPRYFDLYRTEVSGSAAEEGVFQTESIYINEDGFTPSTISDNERYLALSESITTSNSNLYLLDKQTEIRTLITPHEGD